MQEQILGNDSLIASLGRIAASGHVSHAYILNGPEGSGKRLIAAKFAEMIGASAADTIWTEHEKPGLISVDDVRNGINGSVQIRPYDSVHKVYIVDEAEKMNVQAQNALLKTIEEPPEYVVILLLTTNMESFLETIRSRCVHLNVRPLPRESAERWLEAKGYVRPDARMAAALSGGAVGQAVSMLESEEFAEVLDAVTEMLGKAVSGGTRDVLTFTAEMAKHKLYQQTALDYIRIWFRDVLLYKMEQDTEDLVFLRYTAPIREMAGRISYGGANRVLQAVDTAKDRITANVNPEIVFELVALTIREELRDKRE